MAAWSGSKLTLAGGIVGAIVGFIVGLGLARLLNPASLDLPNLLGWTLACVGAWVGSAVARRADPRR